MAQSGPEEKRERVQLEERRERERREQLLRREEERHCICSGGWGEIGENMKGGKG